VGLSTSIQRAACDELSRIEVRRQKADEKAQDQAVFLTSGRWHPTLAFAPLCITINHMLDGMEILKSKIVSAVI